MVFSFVVQQIVRPSLLAPLAVQAVLVSRLAIPCAAWNSRMIQLVTLFASHTKAS